MTKESIEHRVCRERTPQEADALMSIEALRALILRSFNRLRRPGE